MSRVNYTSARRRVAKMDCIVIAMLKGALWVDERQVVRSRAGDELETHTRWFEARMKAMLEELKQYVE